MMVYIAGPMRGYPSLNFPAFAEAASAIRAMGHEVLSPAEADLQDGFDPNNPGVITADRYEAWMARDFAMIDRCDAICMLCGWQDSEGSRRELRHALARGKRIMCLWPAYEYLPARMSSLDVGEWKMWRAKP